MGTLRWEKETEEQAKAAQRRAEFEQRRDELKVAEADTHARIEALQHDLERQRAELAACSSDNDARLVSSSKREADLRRIRSADAPDRVPKRGAPARPGRSGGNGAKPLA